jgi:hypothetical protein
MVRSTMSEPTVMPSAAFWIPVSIAIAVAWALFREKSWRYRDRGREEDVEADHARAEPGQIVDEGPPVDRQRPDDHDREEAEGAPEDMLLDTNGQMLGVVAERNARHDGHRHRQEQRRPSHATSICGAATPMKWSAKISGAGEA